MKLTTVILALLFSVTCLKAQTYIPFPAAQTNAVWTVSLYGKEAYCKDFDLFTNGDTIINGKQYVIVGSRGHYQPWYSTGIGSGYCNNIGSNGIPGYTWLNGREYAYREDSTRKIYWRKIESMTVDTTEVLLYDFNLQVGDSVKGFHANMYNSGTIPVVSSVDSVLIDNNWRKRINFTTEFDSTEGCFYFIEGIGSNSGLLNWQKCPEFEAYINLTCYKVEGVKMFPLNGGDCSDHSYITSVSEKPFNNESTSVYPNPVNNMITISIVGIDKYCQLNIYNQTGQILKTIQLQDINSTLNIEDLIPGIYIFEVKGNANVSQHRIVKI